MTALLLTADELRDLTDYVRPSDQCRWLRSRGYLYEVGASGRPKVLRAEAERHLLGAVKSKTKTPRFDLLGEGG